METYIKQNKPVVRTFSSHIGRGHSEIGAVLQAYRARMQQDLRMSQSDSSEISLQSMHQPVYGGNRCMQFTRIEMDRDRIKSGKADYVKLGKKYWPARDRINFVRFIMGQGNVYQMNDGNDETVQISNFIGGKYDLYEALTPDMQDRTNYWIGWPANSTGDLPSMTTALLMGFPHGIRIYKAQGITAESKLGEVKAYLGGEVDGEYIITDAGMKGCISESKIGHENISFSWLTRVVAAGRYGEDGGGGVQEQLEDPDFSKGYTGKARKKVRETWLGCDSTGVFPYRKAIKQWLGKYLGIDVKKKIFGKTVEILWIRKSGEKGGAHYENDTGLAAVENYIDHGSANVYILAGDCKDNKTSRIVANTSSGMKGVYDLTEFWMNSPKRDLQFWGGDSRTGQFRLYDYLNTVAGSLRHIGSMSGGLEALALLGHEVSYKAKQGETGVGRMERYAVHDQKQLPVDQIRYNRRPFFEHKEIQQPETGEMIDNKGFEKSSAKYYVFFSSGVILTTPDLNGFIDVFCEKYDSRIDYRINDKGLCGKNAENARLLSHQISKIEKEKACDLSAPDRDRIYQTIYKHHLLKARETRECKQQITKWMRQGGVNKMPGKKERKLI